jgi:hypothetical protein
MSRSSTAGGGARSRPTPRNRSWRTRGRFYSEDDTLDYDVLHYDVDVAFTPDRQLVEGTSRLKLKILGRSVSTLTLRLADSLQVRSVSSPEFGRLLHMRVVDQSVLIVNLPGVVVEGSEFWVAVTYAGRVQPQTLDREIVAVGQQEIRDTGIPMEPHYLYSHRSYWYPQALVSDYASATLRIAVPANLDVVATGQPAAPPSAPERGRRVFTFETAEPVRYLACVISRFTELEPRTVEVHGRRTHRAPRARQSATGRPRAGDDVRRGRHAGVLCVARGWQALPEPDARRVGERPPGRPQPSLLRPRAPGDADDRTRVAQRSGQLRRLPAVLPGARDRASVVGACRRVEELPRAVDQRRDSRSTSRRSMPSATAATAPSPPCCGRCARRRSRHRTRAPSTWAIGSATCATTIASSARSSTTRARWCSTCCGGWWATTRSSVACATFYAEWRFRKAGTDDFRQVMEAASGRELTRFFETWIYGCEHSAGHLPIAGAQRPGGTAVRDPGARRRRDYGHHPLCRAGARISWCRSPAE